MYESSKRFPTANLKRAQAALVFAVLCLSLPSLCQNGAPVEAGRSTATLSSGSIEIFFDIPKAFSRSGYTGDIPITLGIPFKQGQLRDTAFMEVEDQYETGHTHAHPADVHASPLSEH